MYLLLLFFSSLLAAQEVVRLEGVLLERGTRKPLKDVNLFILPHKVKATTDAEGKFWFEGIPKGECQLIVNSSGHIKYDQTFNCKDFGKKTLYLEKKSYTSFETTASVAAYLN